MAGFADFFVEFLQVNEEIPFRNVALLIGVYLLSLWVVVSIWVFFDAKKRYESEVTAALFALLVFFLNFPILIFYFAVRPDITFEDFDDWEAGGVNVPIVNFMGKDGIEMSFELRVHPKRLRDSDKSPDMNIQIGWDNKEEKFKMIDREQMAHELMEVEKKKKKKGSKTLVTYFREVAGKVKTKITEMSTRKSPENIESNEDNSEKSESVEVESVDQSDSKIKEHESNQENNNSSYNTEELSSLNKELKDAQSIGDSQSEDDKENQNDSDDNYPHSGKNKKKKKKKNRF
ncbi:MAG TPA: hypothetical protein VGA67_05640 [Candidatus Dojkabacteria bacterium]|jgi:hypothetical protein